MNRIERMLLVVRDDIYPLTKKEVARGNHVFGGAVLRKDDLGLVTAGSNARIDSPLFHGEVDTLNRFFRIPAAGRPASRDLIFLATHDPCPMCAASIAWAGFGEIWTLFDYGDVQDSFGMPVDLMMYRDVFGCDGVKKTNSFFHKHSLKEEAEKAPESVRLLSVVDEIKKLYESLDVQDFEYPGM